MQQPVHVSNRTRMLLSLREELVGPSPQGIEIDCSRPLSFTKPAEAYGPFRQAQSGEEILMRDPPRRRYGVGVLYPRGSDSVTMASDEPADARETIEGEPGVLSEQAADAIERIEARSSHGGDPEGDDFDLSSANAFEPSSMGISFVADLPPHSKLVVEVPQEVPETGYKVNGRYRMMSVVVAGARRQWYLREPVYARAVFQASDLCADEAVRLVDPTAEKRNLDGLDLQIEVYSRPMGLHTTRLITVCLVNRERSSGGADDEKSLYQSYFRAWVEAADREPHILPYPSSELVSDEEDETLALLYRHFETFAVGHGCAASWPRSHGGNRQVSWVSAECLPTVETPSMTPDIFPKGAERPLKISMAALAGLVPKTDGLGELEALVGLYERWIEDRRTEIPSLEKKYRAAAERNLNQAAEAAARMREGLRFLQSDPMAFKAFQLTNHAILLQQLRSGTETRKMSWDAKAQRITFSAPPPEITPSTPNARRGFWRPFQAAFLLMTLRSAVDGSAQDRNTVDLIWFPTGGGKTEAYLGLAAFSMLIRRLRNPQDSGTQVLMRYTLRLLTAQQFQRAAGLIVALEHLRRLDEAEMGQTPFSIGLWLGGESTPNWRKDAIKALRKLSRDAEAENPFVLTRCPWCGAQLGPVKQKSSVGKSKVGVPGYEEDGGSVRFRCTDANCEFRGELPVYVVDEDVYEHRPSMVIGTVDKFANLAWRPEARALFGLNDEGQRTSSPPGLIIQDELHLIAGPLGSMVGLFEAVIDELCTDRRSAEAISPKIVCSTATIRRHQEQIKSLYARPESALFPPPGLDASDSFFARYETNADGTLASGRMYVGVHAPGLGSMQTVQVRSFTALLQTPVAFQTPDERDPWWSLLVFFNSLRELGTTLTLLQSDIPDYFTVLRHRLGFDAPLRTFYNVKELTSRLRGDEVPEAIAELSTKYSGQPSDVVDICLASNIIEVGVDIDRLSLMAIVGQPKSTSQYIQVSGRVGRQGPGRPGLVVTLYGASKPRDRSHFEKFRSYHERLYAQVEPTSVTPFSPPVLDRALHAVMVAYARQVGRSASGPYPYPKNVIDFLHGLLGQRVKVVDPNEFQTFEQVFTRRATEWETWERTEWAGSWQSAEIPLLRETGAYAKGDQKDLSWPTPRSMRNVDSECMAVVTNSYLKAGQE